MLALALLGGSQGAAPGDSGVLKSMVVGGSLRGELTSARNRNLSIVEPSLPPVMTVANPRVNTAPSCIFGEGRFNLFEGTLTFSSHSVILRSFLEVAQSSM